MAMLLLLSTVSITVEKHYCGDTLIDVAVFSEVDRCGMEASENEQKTITKKSCCKDIIDVIEGQDQLTVKVLDDLDLDQQQFLLSYVIAYKQLFESLPKQTIPNLYYPPPEIVRDIQVLDEVYLI
ncbi:MAG: hypothetical protein JJ905_03940 [Psychroserpens sp.]|nr:hypothetical protein [Psychroserpens sp.]MBO6630886.1 hypothetical protein [Psychroserpens sp.]MBO6652651.1 hypothetical protein [Psychroserpens sp.]MBO6681577.1 hypothetical protein [Psychroserpens sp.]MBO6749352.1 hypothetical protein [Psychroserpens sp.]